MANSSQHRSIAASQHRSIAASQHRSIAASQHRSIAASEHRCHVLGDRAPKRKNGGTWYVPPQADFNTEREAKLPSVDYMPHPQLGAAISQPQDGAAISQPQLGAAAQPLSHPPQLLRAASLAFSLAKRPGPFLQEEAQGSQATSHPQEGATISQPQVGAATAHPPQLDEPQVSHAGIAISQPQEGAAISHPQLGAAAQGSQADLAAHLAFRRANRPWRGAEQPVSHPQPKSQP